MDFLVIGLFEVSIPESNRVERLRSLETDQVVDQLGDCGAGLGRADRYGDHNFSRMFGAQCSNGGPHRRTRREPIVHKNSDSIRDGRKGAVVAVESLAPREREAFTFFDPVEDIRIHAIGA